MQFASNAEEMTRDAEQQVPKGCADTAAEKTSATEFATFRAAMMAADPWLAGMHDMGDGHCLFVCRLLFHWTVKRGEIGDTCSVIEQWCYANRLLAEYAVEEWRQRGWAGEPIGWHKHPSSGRARPGGDPTKESIGYEQ